MPKYRMMYFVYSKGKLRDEPGINGKLGKLFGYKSDGHLYPDIQSLFDEGFLEKKEGFIIPTVKLGQEFAIFKGAHYISVGCVIMGAILFAYAELVTMGYLRFNLIAVGAASASLFVLALIFTTAYSKLVPRLPSKEEIRDSGLQSS